MPIFRPSLASSIGIALCFFAVVFTVFGGALHHEFVDWDDNVLIEGNPIIASISPQTIAKAFTSYDPELYVPLTFLSFQIDHAIGGFHPSTFHFTNIVLHTLNALLVAWILCILLENVWLALGLGLLFALHPLNTEAAMWASARKDVLSTFFLLATLIAFTYGNEKKKWYYVSIGLFVLALLSKVMVVTLPIILMLFECEKTAITKRFIKKILPFITLAIAFGIIALYGKMGALTNITPWQTLLLGTKSTIFYLQKFLVPTELSVLYPYTKNIQLFSVDILMSLATTILLIVWTCRLWRTQRLFAMGLMFFLITLVPTFTNAVRGGDIYLASDRYTYVPMFGLLLCTGALIKYFLSHASTVLMLKRRSFCVLVMTVWTIATFGYLANVQARTWKNTETLFSQTLRYYPDSHTAYNNIGMVYLERGETDEAISFLQKAIAAKSDTKTWNNLAAAKMQKGLYDEAFSIFTRVIAMDAQSVDAYYGLGNWYQKQKKYTESVSMYQKALAIDENYSNAYNNLGAVYMLMHDWENASNILQKSIQLKPDFAESYYNLGIVQAELSEDEKAQISFSQAIERNPQDADAYASRAKLFYKKQMIDETAKDLQKALSIHPKNQTAYDVLLQLQKDGLASKKSSSTPAR